VLQFGQHAGNDFLRIGVTGNQKSSWTNYPDFYKFMSMDIELSLDSLLTDRSHVGILDLFGDIGGLLEIVTVMCGYLAYKFSKIRLDSIITNRLYHISDDNKDFQKAMKLDKGAVNDCDSPLRTRPNGDIEVDVPHLLGMKIFWNKICICKKRNKNLDSY